MIAGIVKLLPFLQILLEAFQPGDGERVTRVGKITTLAFVLLLTYSMFVSYAYVVQYHSLVQVREHDQYMERQSNDKDKTLNLQADELRALYARIFECLSSRPPYESGSGHAQKQADMPAAPVAAPEAPIHASPSPTKKESVANKPVGPADMNRFRMEILKNLNEE